MKQKWVVSLLGAASLALCSSSAFAAGILDATQAKCSDTIQNETIKVISAIQKQIKTSIKNNRNGKDSLCSGGLACAGGNGANGKACTSNAHCAGFNTTKTDPTPGTTPAPVTECTTNLAKGIAGAINNAKAALRKNIAAKCSEANLTTLGFPTARCPDTSGGSFTTTDLADCILGGAIGDIPNGIFGDPAGEVLGRGAGTFLPDSPSPIKSCGVTLGSVLQIGSLSTASDPTEPGGAAPLTLENCVGPACDTKGSAFLMNKLTAPTDSVGIALCLVTSTDDAGNGTTQDGTINLSSGAQTSTSPISTEVYGGKCPKCDATVGPTFKRCVAGALAGNPGPNGGRKCTNAGSTDIACPPGTTVIATIPNPLSLSTGTTTLTVPILISNPAGVLCGACNGDPAKGCQSDGACGLDAPCDFGSNTGAFGDLAATQVVAVGHPGPILPRLAGAFCTGSADAGGTIDSTQGLPGPVRLVQQQLNAFEYILP